MNTKKINIAWVSDQVYPTYRLYDLTDNPELGLMLVEFSGDLVGEISSPKVRPTFSATVTISKGIYGLRELVLTAIDADGESAQSVAYFVEIDRKPPQAPEYLVIA